MDSRLLAWTSAWMTGLLARAKNRGKSTFGAGEQGEATVTEAHWHLSVGGSVERPLRAHLQLQHIEWPDRKRQIRSF